MRRKGRGLAAMGARCEKHPRGAKSKWEETKYKPGMRKNGKEQNTHTPTHTNTNIARKRRRFAF